MMYLYKDIRYSIIQAGITGNLTEQYETDTPVKETYELIQEEKKKFEQNTGNVAKKTYCIRDDEVVVEIPENWMWVRLGSVSKLIQYGYTASASVTGTTKFLRITDIQNNVVRWEDVPFCSPSDKEIETYALHNRDIMIARTGGTVGKTYIVRQLNEKAVFASYLIRVVPSEYLNEEFLKMFTESPLYWNQLIDYKKGTGQPNVNGKKLEKLILPLPPIEEQERIVKRLNEILPEVEKYKELEDEINKVKLAFPKELEGAIIQSAIQGKQTQQLDTDSSVEELLTNIKTKKQELVKKKVIKKEKELDCISDDELPFEIPDNWKWERLGNLCSKIGAGSTPQGGAANYVSSGIPFIREQNVYNDGLHAEGLAFITEEMNEKKKGSKVMPDDILLNITGGSIGRCALVPDDFITGNVNQHVLIIRNINPTMKKYIHLVIMSPYIQNMIMDKQVGDKEGLSATKTKNFPIPIPPLEEQERIVARVEALIPLCSNLEIE